MSSAREEFAVYQRFNDQEAMEALARLFAENDIPFKQKEQRDNGPIGQAIVGTPLQPSFWIEIPATSFAKANALLYAEAEQHLSEEDLAAHPFSQYSLDELREVLLERDKWDPEAVIIARRMLEKSDPNFDFGAIELAIESRLQQEYAPKQVNGFWLILLTLIGVVTAVILWFFGIMVTLGFLLYYRLGSNRDHNGKKHYAYENLEISLVLLFPNDCFCNYWSKQKSNI